ncbi:Succinate dehydrogenase flavoprotein subunit [plant metagenome]|uniref:Succinate dehydrogenase flavoprotein subunit n=1 Tax=plant metagenome TaxID=1297885 RepID=A0A484TMT8_9ZZZZ
MSQAVLHSSFSSEAPPLHADVLVLGGGPAGAWAALTAARAGAEVVLADKGHCGTSGAAAASNNSVWYVPQPEDYPRHHAERYDSGGQLSEREWVDAVLAQAAAQLHLFAELGYPFPRTQSGALNYASLRGPDAQRLLRQLLRRAGVTILDHSPATGLLRDGAAVVGAQGWTREGAHWQAWAPATVIATGGCAFLSGALGTNVCTGDGQLAAAEAGALFSGMEFSNQYGLSAAFSSVTKGLPFHWASYYRADGREIEVEGEEPFVAVARVLQEEAVYACFDRADADIERWLRSAQANAFLPYDRMGIDPFSQRFPVGLRLEGTVRGTGGILLRDRSGATQVPGLYAAGDAASREPIVGGRSGGGSPNGAWAIATGTWAGKGAWEHAQRVGRVRHADTDPCSLRVADPAAALAVIRRELWPLGKNVFREEASLLASLQALDDAWAQPVQAGAGQVAAGRQARAMLLMGRMAYRSALARRESRALHQRLDHPASQGHPYRQHVRGLDTLSVSAAAMRHAEPAP